MTGWLRYSIVRSAPSKPIDVCEEGARLYFGEKKAKETEAKASNISEARASSSNSSGFKFCPLNLATYRLGPALIMIDEEISLCCVIFQTETAMNAKLATK